MEDPVTFLFPPITQSQKKRTKRTFTSVYNTDSIFQSKCPTWMQSIRTCHTDRLALLRCCINRVTSPPPPTHTPTTPASLPPPHNTWLMSTRNLVPCFLKPPWDLPLQPENTCCCTEDPIKRASLRHRHPPSNSTRNTFSGTHNTMK